MRAEWLVREERKRLILFFAGWGMDSRPFSEMSALESDVLMFFDYREQEIPLPLEEICAKYEVVSLIAWSLGVAVAQNCFSGSEIAVDSAVAVNGTLFPADDRYGIPESVFDGTLDALSPESLLRFYRRMCGTRNVTDAFVAHAPDRSIEDLASELAALRFIKGEGAPIYDAALVGKKDRIVPPENQLNCWQGRGVKVCAVDAPHIPFHLYGTWEDISGPGESDG